MIIIIEPKYITKVLAWIVAALTLGHGLGGLYYFLNPTPDIPWIVKEFHFDHEQNIPSLYSSLALIFCAGLFFLIARAKKLDRDYYYWMGLAIVFVFLSIDESTSIHEQLIPVVRNTLQTSGFLYFSWVIPYSVALLLFVAFYTRFLFRLPAKTRILFIIAGCIYTLGAIGFELIGGYYYDTFGARNFRYQLALSIEELLEMMGIVVLVYTLTCYIDSELNELRIRISSKYTI